MPFINAYDDDPDPEAVPGACPATADPRSTTRQWCGKEYRYSDRAKSWQVKDARRGTWKKLTNQYIIAALEL